MRVTMATMTCGEGDRMRGCRAPDASGFEALGLGCPRFRGGHCGVHGAPAVVREDGHHALLCPCDTCGHPDDE